MDNKQRTKRILERIEELAAITEEEGIVTRTFGTKAFVEGRDMVVNWMKEAGLETRIDSIGNARGILRSAHPEARTFIIGSHIDTVVNAGKFDGPLGVIMGIELADMLREEERLSHNLEVIAFCDEEGVRFHSTYLGSKAVAGNFEPHLLMVKDANGIELETAIKESGGDPDHILEEGYKKEQVAGYFEIHIEQGPVLEKEDVPVGIVTAIAGQRRMEICFMGVAGHAGTVPMGMRQDALAGAAEFITSVESYAANAKNNVVATVGKLTVKQATSNVIPSDVTLTVDLRSSDESDLSAGYEAINGRCEEICDRRHLYFNWKLVQETEPAECDESLNEMLATAIADTDYPVIELISGAGHDAVAMAAIMPVSMLFVKCYKGISHNPLENVEKEDIAAALEVSENFLRIVMELNQNTA
jgi:allantoate deiminase